MDRPTLLFDAQCYLCTIWKQWIEQGVGGEPIAFADANNRPLARAMGIVDTDRLDREMCLLDTDGRASWGYDALVALADLRPGLSIVGWAMRLRPIRVLGFWAYRLVTRRRGCAAS